MHDLNKVFSFYPAFCINSKFYILSMLKLVEIPILSTFVYLIENVCWINTD